MSTLSAREGYRLWAPRYHEETVVSLLEQRLVESLGVPTRSRRLLDVGCGTARRLAGQEAELLAGADLSPEMLALAPATQRPRLLHLAAADMRALPFGAARFDVVWCRLAIGHVAEVDAAYSELARVCRPGGDVLVSDFHPDAARSGHRRTFRDAQGATQDVVHHVHLPNDHVAAAGRAGLGLRERRDGMADPGVRDLYARANRLDAYETHSTLGPPLVLVLTYRKAA